MTSTIVSVVKDFHPQPYGRYDNDSPGCEETSGQTFRRNILVPALREFDYVKVDLTGYNRYGRSFLDEAFGGLIREEGFSGEDLRNKLTWVHEEVKSIESVIKERLIAAEESSNQEKGM